MVKADLIKKISDATRVSKQEAERIMESILDGIKNSLVRGEKVELRGLGTFLVKNRAPRLARSMKTGESIPLPSRRVPVFKTGRELKSI